MSAQAHLARYGVTLEQARDFIFQNLGSPDVIYNACLAYGVTNDMLAEMVGGGVTAHDVRSFWASRGFDASLLDDHNDALPPYEIVIYQTLITSNADSTGILTTAALRERVIAQTSVDAYWRAFSPDAADDEDALIILDETIIPRLAEVPHTPEGVEDYFYGTIVKPLKNLGWDDQEEIAALQNFVSANQAALAAGDNAATARFAQMLHAIYGDPTTQPLLSDEQIAEVAVLVGVAQVTGADIVEIPALDGLFAPFVG